MAVFVLDRYQKPLMPCTQKRARKLLGCGRARVHRFFPFAIRLIDRAVGQSILQAIALKTDPSSKITGIAVVRQSETTDTDTGEVRRSAHVLCLFDLIHRGGLITKALTARRNMRRRRRGNLRYRAPRFLNRGNEKNGWLPPVTSIAQELVRFDMQQMENPKIAGTEYQQGRRAGYEAREYLLEKWHRTCAYCDATGVPLEIDHIYPRSRGGSNRISNLALACRPCNQKKGSCDVAAFLEKDPARLRRIQAQAKRPLKDAAAVNATRWKLLEALKAMGLPVTTGSGGLTKFNRTRLGIPKTHALDAVCAGTVDTVTDWHRPTLTIKATGCGSYQRTRVDAFGFPRGYLVRKKRIKGFQAGDMVVADVSKGKKVGQFRGRIAVRASGNFNIQTPQGVVQGISHRYCRIVQRADGYGYLLAAKMDVTGTPPKQRPLRGPRSASPA